MVFGNMVIFGFMVNFYLVPTWTIYPGASVSTFRSGWRKCALRSSLKYPLVSRDLATSSLLLLPPPPLPPPPPPAMPEVRLVVLPPRAFARDLISERRKNVECCFLTEPKLTYPILSMLEIVKNLLCAPNASRYIFPFNIISEGYPNEISPVNTHAVRL